MSVAVPFPLPPGRVLSAWRRELAAFRPSQLRLAHLLLHRVEALVRVVRPHIIDPFQAALLRQLSSGATPEQLRLDRRLLARWLRDLVADGLAEAADGGWRPTERGRRALEAGSYTSADEERRDFTFLDESGPDGVATFLPLPGAVALAAPPGWRFDAAALLACVDRPPDWKERHGFPTDVQEVVAPPGSSSPADGATEGRGEADWRRVILDRPEQIVLVFIRSDDAAPQWLGFAAKPEGWTLQTASPALILPADEVLPELADEPTQETWREAWRGWCLGRGQSAADVDACCVELLEDRVRVVAPRSLAARLGGERNDAWLLTGTGRVRVAAPLEIVEEG